MEALGLETTLGLASSVLASALLSPVGMASPVLGSALLSSVGMASPVLGSALGLVIAPTICGCRNT